MRIRHIPRKLLIHSVTHGYNPANSTWGNTTFGGTRTVSYVRIEPSSKLVVTKDGKQVQLSAVMFYDAVNSSPIGITFAENDGVTFGSKTYTVVSVDTIYDNADLHHVEVGLI